MSVHFDINALKARLSAALPNASISVRDLTGTGDHFAVEVTSELFAGMGQIARHRKVYAALSDVIGGAVHALALQTCTPQEADAKRVAQGVS